MTAAHKVIAATGHHGLFGMPLRACVEFQHLITTLAHATVGVLALGGPRLAKSGPRMNVNAEKLMIGGHYDLMIYEHAYRMLAVSAPPAYSS